MVWAVGIREGTKHCRLRGNKGMTEIEEEEEEEEGEATAAHSNEDPLPQPLLRCFCQ